MARNTGERGLVRRTPVIGAGALKRRVGSDRVLLKLECLQRTGSFKLRGAVCKLAAMSAGERERGVVTASAGNHGLGLALAGARLGVPVEVLVPETSPQVKRAGIEASGARVTVVGRNYDAAERRAREVAAQRGIPFVSPFDDLDVIRGNGGGVAEELIDQVTELARVVCPVGGGGLVAGLAEALVPRGIDVVGIQPRANCAMSESLRLDRAQVDYVGSPTVAEGCEGAVSVRTFEICRLHRVVTELVDEEAIERAVAFAYRHLGVVIEPSAGVALAAVLEGVITPMEGGMTAVVLTGGNIEPSMLDDILWRHSE